MRQKYFLISACIFLVFALSSCSTSSTTHKTDFYKGYEGIDISFLPQTPPDLLYYDTRAPGMRDNNFEVGIKIENKGAADALGLIYIGGYDRSIIDLAGDYENNDLPNMGSLDISIDGIGNALRIGLSGAFSGRFAGFGVGAGADFVWHTRPSGGGTDSYGTRETKGPKLKDWYVSITSDSFGYSLINELGTNLRVVFRNLHARSIFVLHGNRQDYPGGESEILIFPGFVYDLPGVEHFDPTFSVKACYVYATRADPFVCIDPNPDAPVKKVCDADKVISLAGGQGGPVAVSRVTTISSPTKIIFTIDVEHRGDGKIYDYRNAFHKCDPFYEDGRYSDYDVVYVEYVKLSARFEAGYDDIFKCWPESKAIRLINGKGTIRCEYMVANDATASNQAFEAPLLIELRYGYGESIEKEMKIRKMG